MTAFSVKAARRLSVSALPLVVLVLACATETQQGELDSGTLSSGASGGSDATAGTGATGATGAADTGGSSSGGTTGSPVAGSSSSVGGSGGSESAGSGGMGEEGGGSAGSESGGTGGMGGTGGSAGAGGSGGSGGSAGAAGMGGSGGAASTGYRYARLTATSEQGGHVWSSCAELQLFTTGSVVINRTGWTVTADSEETVDESAPATNAIDGDAATYWHTEWVAGGATDPPLPHSLTVDLGSEKPVIGFSYLPRQNRENGRIKDYAFYLSKDGQNWGTPVKTGTFPNDATLQTVYF